MTSNIRYNIDKKANAVEVTISGDIDHHSAKNLREQIDALIDEHHPTTLILDLSRVDFMDSSGLGLVFGRLRRQNQHGGTAVVRSPSERTGKILELAGASRLIDIVN